MATVNIHEAKTHLSKLIERVLKGEHLVIAKAGKPLVELRAIDGAGQGARRIGFMPNLTIPEDFDQMGQDEISRDFEG